jgi:hypothetical protein
MSMKFGKEEKCYNKNMQENAWAREATIERLDLC